MKEGGKEIQALLKETNKVLRVSNASPDWRVYVDYVSNRVVNGANDRQTQSPSLSPCLSMRVHPCSPQSPINTPPERRASPRDPHVAGVLPQRSRPPRRAQGALLASSSHVRYMHAMACVRHDPRIIV